MKHPIRSLNAFARRMHKKYPTMNYGGCCVFAAMVTKHLQQVFPTAVAVGGYGDEPPIDEVRNNVRKNTPFEWNMRGVYFCHVVAEIEIKGKKYFFDTKGVRKASDHVGASGGWPLIEGRLTQEEAEELGNTKSGWNSSFNRKQIPKIQKDVNKYFEKFVKRMTACQTEPAAV